MTETKGAPPPLPPAALLASIRQGTKLKAASTILADANSSDVSPSASTTASSNARSPVDASTPKPPMLFKPDELLAGIKAKAAQRAAGEVKSVATKPPPPRHTESIAEQAAKARAAMLERAAKRREEEERKKAEEEAKKKEEEEEEKLHKQRSELDSTLRAEAETIAAAAVARNKAIQEEEKQSRIEAARKKFEQNEKKTQAGKLAAAELAAKKAAQEEQKMRREAEEATKKAEEALRKAQEAKKAAAAASAAKKAAEEERLVQLGVKLTNTDKGKEAPSDGATTPTKENIDDECLSEARDTLSPLSHRRRNMSAMCPSTNSAPKKKKSRLLRFGTTLGFAWRSSSPKDPSRQQSELESENSFLSTPREKSSRPERSNTSFMRRAPQCKYK